MLRISESWCISSRFALVNLYTVLSFFLLTLTVRFNSKDTAEWSLIPLMPSELVKLPTRSGWLAITKSSTDACLVESETSWVWPWSSTMLRNFWFTKTPYCGSSFTVLLDQSLSGTFMSPAIILLGKEPLACKQSNELLRASSGLMSLFRWKWINAH